VQATTGLDVIRLKVSLLLHGVSSPCFRISSLRNLVALFNLYDYPSRFFWQNSLFQRLADSQGSGTMSGATSSKDAPLSQLTASSDEQPNQRRIDADCQICRNLRLPEPCLITTTYAELQGAASDRCELCDLLRQASEMVCIDVELSVLDSNEIYIYPRKGKTPENNTQVAVFWRGKPHVLETRNIHLSPGTMSLLGQVIGKQSMVLIQFRKRMFMAISGL
jgi:hypothetical protein